MKVLQDQIRQIRKSKGMTQEELAEALGVTAASVSKWENGQSAPELGALCAMADFFEVSVDALLGHTLKGSRRIQMVEQLKALTQQKEYDQAKELSQTLLCNYPNDYEVVDAGASLYYCISISTGDKAAMNTSIELVKRLFPLVKGEDNARFGLLSRLANQYELLEDWETARKYYTEGNVNGSNDRPLAYLEAKEKGDKDAVAKISGLFATSLFHAVMDALKIKELWEALGEKEKAAAAVKWSIGAIESGGRSLCKEFTSLLITLYLSMMSVEEESAAVYAPKITALAAGAVSGEATEFLMSNDVKLIASQTIYDADLLQNLLAELSAATSEDNRP